jgi:hypothetical protein
MKLTRFWFLLAVLTLTAASLGFGVAGAPQPQSVFWSINGNENTDPSINFLGTTNNRGLAFRTNNLERVRLTADGKVGIGTSIPQERLHIAGNLQLEGDLKCATPCVDGTEIVDGSIGVTDVNTLQVQARVGGYSLPELAKGAGSTGPADTSGVPGL